MLAPCAVSLNGEELLKLLILGRCIPGEELTDFERWLENLAVAACETII